LDEVRLSIVATSRFELDITLRYRVKKLAIQTGHYEYRVSRIPGG